MKKCRRGKGTAKDKQSHLELSGDGLTHVDSQLPQIRVKLAREPQARCGTRHNDGNKVVEIAISGSGELEGPEADVIESFVINAESLVGVLDELMDGKSGVVGLFLDNQYR